MMGFQRRGPNMGGEGQERFSVGAAAECERDGSAGKSQHACLRRHKCDTEGRGEGPGQDTQASCATEEPGLVPERKGSLGEGCQPGARSGRCD